MSTHLEAFKVAVQQGMKIRFVTFEQDAADIDKIISGAHQATLAKVQTTTSNNNATVMPTDLILMAKTYPTLDENLKTVLLSITKTSSLTPESNPVQILTEWMLSADSKRYSLFVEILKEIAHQAKEKPHTEKQEATKTEVGRCCVLLPSTMNNCPNTDVCRIGGGDYWLCHEHREMGLTISNVQQYQCSFACTVGSLSGKCCPLDASVLINEIPWCQVHRRQREPARTICNAVGENLAVFKCWSFDDLDQLSNFLTPYDQFDDSE
jgi:hypothetical protein